MTPAERMRRHRERKRNGETPGLTIKQLAASVHISERLLYYARQHDRFKAFEWDPNIFAKAYGRIGMSFIADVSKHASPGAERAIHDLIVEEGAKVARQVWKMVKADELRRLNRRAKKGVPRHTRDPKEAPSATS